MRYRLSVDFGTTNTAAAIQVGSGEPRQVRLGTRSDSIPSAVTAYQGGLRVGDEAVRLRLLDPSAHEPTPKRRLDDSPSVVLAGQPVAPMEMVAAVLREVLRVTLSQTDGVPPEQTVLTHPQVWQEPRQALLHSAAVEAGFAPGTIALASEPVCAAWYYAARTAIAANDRIGVVDFGGGTFDVAVLSFGAVRGGGRGFSVLATDGIDPLGGQDFDALLADWVLAQLELQGRTDLLDRLKATEGLAARLNLHDQVREAKHALSEAQSSPVIVTVGDISTTVMATAEEFETLIRPAVSDAVQMTAETISAADPSGRSRPDSLQRMFLTGGSSLIPLVQRELQRLTGGKVARIDDPKQVTSLGALCCPGLVPFGSQQTSGGGGGLGQKSDQGLEWRPPPPPEPTATATGGQTLVGRSAGGTGPGPGNGLLPGTAASIPVRGGASRKKVGLWIAASVAALVVLVGSVLALQPDERFPPFEPTSGPSDGPTNGPTDGPTDGPTNGPTDGPTDGPTNGPTDGPADGPTDGCVAELSSDDCATVQVARGVVDIRSCSYEPSGQTVYCYPADNETLSGSALVYLYTRESVEELTALADERFQAYEVTGTVGTDRDNPPAKAGYGNPSVGLVYTGETAGGSSLLIWSVNDDQMLYVMTSSEDTVAELLSWWEDH